jgi:hypothetical protein
VSYSLAPLLTALLTDRLLAGAGVGAVLMKTTEAAAEAAQEQRQQLAIFGILIILILSLEHTNKTHRHKRRPER